MTTRLYRTFQALILALLGVFLFFKVWDGSVTLYIHSRFVMMTVLAVFLLAGLAQAMLADRPPSGSPGDTTAGSWRNLFWLALPLIIGVLIPNRPLGAQTAERRGINTRAPLTASAGAEAVSLELPPDQRNILDWIRVFNRSDDPSAVMGESIDVVGFVYRDPRLAEGQFMVARFGVTCCLADATAIGLPVAWVEASGLRENDWVRVRGVVALMPFDGKRIPGIQAGSVESVAAPQQPYLFP